MNHRIVSERAHWPAVAFRHAIAWWTLAIAFFGIADVVITLFALYGYAPESHFAYLAILSLFEATLPVPFFYQLVTTLTAWKLVTLAVFYVIYRVAPRTYRMGVPVGLTTLGVAVLAWNLHAIGLF